MSVAEAILGEEFKFLNDSVDLDDIFAEVDRVSEFENQVPDLSEVYREESERDEKRYSSEPGDNYKLASCYSMCRVLDNGQEGKYTNIFKVNGVGAYYFLAGAMHMRDSCQSYEEQCRSGVENMIRENEKAFASSPIMRESSKDMIRYEIYRLGTQLCRMAESL